MKLSLIIPAKNEEDRIGTTLEDYGEYLSKKLSKDFEILVVLNGCTDDSLGVVKKKIKKYNQIKCLNFEEGLGKGGAVIEGFDEAEGDLIGFVDADGATRPEALYDLIRKLKEYDGAIASRWIKGAKIVKQEPFKRVVASRGFNLLVRMLFWFPFTDTQCGAKIFRKKAVKKVLPELGITNFSFDIDLLFRLYAKKYKLVEIPTVWEHKEGSTLNLRKTTLDMFLSVIRLRLIYSPLKFIVKIYDKLPESIKIHHKLK